MSMHRESVTNTGAAENKPADDSVTRRLAEAAHSAIDETAEKTASVEAKLRDNAARAGDKIEATQAAAGKQARRSLDQVETFVKENPVAAAGIAFAAGILTSALLRR
ncbi:MAG: DUF883 domain-containing protein [Planctomycetes bacterium]|jgi:ElaB/YqjD/DUF883 family membrane-anchored ribosome-binding protein|nr:DUF883 domain-containing protein [Planctomycetota bacterium]